MPTAHPLRPTRRRPSHRLVPAVLRRHPPLWWAATLLLAGTSAGVVANAVSGAQAAAARYGTVATALVATRDLEPGAVLDPASAELRELPAALVPAGAAGADALGRRLTAAVHRGEVVHRGRVAPFGLSAVAALLPPGTRGLAVPAGPEALTLQVGDGVDVLATTGDPAAVPPTVTVAAAAVVVGVTEDAVTVAVPQEDATRVAYALTTGLVTLALRGG